MISDSGENELRYLFWNETNDEESREWRLELTEEEQRLTQTWDDNFTGVYSALK